MRIPFVVTHIVVLVLLVFASSTGCHRSELSTGVSDSTFVKVMAELRRVRDTPGIDSGQRAARRDSTLQKFGLTPAQLEAAAKQLARNPARAQTVWQAIDRRASDTTKVK
jgi:hypothetical protein